jgi:hypothetical protein
MADTENIPETIIITNMLMPATNGMADTENILGM